MHFIFKISSILLLLLSLSSCNIYKVSKLLVLEDSNRYNNLTDFSYLSREIYFLKNKKAINSIINKRIKLAYVSPRNYQTFKPLHKVKNAVRFESEFSKNRNDLLKALTKVDSIFVIYNLKKQEYKFIEYRNIPSNIDKYKDNLFTYYIYELIIKNTEDAHGQIDEKKQLQPLNK